MPLAIQLPLVDNATDPIISGTTTYTNALTNFTAANASYEWPLVNVQAKCDLITLDSGWNDSSVKKRKDKQQMIKHLHLSINKLEDKLLLR